ncbi:Spc97 Spc98 domain containing protein [Trichuris trichiura]|uniref:Gamma-tubulin complex component n=1 Tax=Trichuris trichiura TaxID=36087 RepID=A0A077ZAC1_TRITR|nr:Spc97 Spc98 domain containing protein [Trichuris trichiura]
MMKKLLASKDHGPSRSSKETFRLLLGAVDEEVRTKFLKLYRQLMLSSAITTSAIVDFLVELLKLKSVTAKSSSNEKVKEIVSSRKVLHYAKAKNSKPAAGIPPELEGKSKAAAEAGQLDFRMNPEKQRQIISDLLYCLQGATGESLLFKFSEELDSKEKFIIHSSCDAGLRNFIEPFFPVCMDVRRLSDFVERQRTAGIVHSEISMAFRKFLREHLVHGVEWRRLLASDQLTYQSLWLYLQSTRKVFRCLARLCESIDKQQTRGGATLELIEKFANAYVGDAIVMPIITHVQLMAGSAYFEFLNDWLRTGHLDDPYGEFMINLGEAASVALRTGSMEEVSRYSSAL